MYNESRSFKTSELRPLIDFVAARCQTPYMAHLVVQEHGKSLTEGYSWKNSPGIEDPTAPSRVRVTLSTVGSFPKRSTYVASVGSIEVRNWQEDFLFVFAHEMRHVSQYWTTDEVPEDYEADAEHFALKVLNEYRAEKNKVVPLRKARTNRRMAA